MTLTGKQLFWALFLSLFGLFAQAQKTGGLKGTVIDEEDGQPIIGASVQIVGTYNNTITDFDGNYIFTGIKAGDYTIKVQYMGYGTKEFTGITIKEGAIKVLNIKLSSSREVLQTVTVVGKKSQVDLEVAASEISFGKEEISKLNVRNVSEIVTMQAGVMKTPDGIQIRGARVYETEYLVEGVSAQDPLAGTGFGVNVNSSSLESLDLITGGAGAEYGGGSSGVISTKIREAGDKLDFALSWQTDHFGDFQPSTSFNQDIIEASLGFPIPGTKKKVTMFNNVTMNLTDEYFGSTATQLNSSLLPSAPEQWAPRYTNAYTHSFKLAWQLKPGTKITLTNQHSLNINQNSRTLQIVGFDAILSPGFQYSRSNNLDNATTYTHQSNLTVINFNHLINARWGFNASVGRLFTNLRADANGRPFRDETVDKIYDEDNIITAPIGIFNNFDPSGIYYVLPGNGLVNNGGITNIWHDHYAEEYTIKSKFNFFPEDKVNEVSFGFEHVLTEYQWVDVNSPWVGAPIKINDSTTTPSISIGSSNDIWKVNPQRGGIFVQDKIVYKGIIATLGMRLNYWAPGKFADDAVNDPTSPVIDQVREDYIEKTIPFAGLRWKARLLPRLNVSFPVTDNNVLYFNYGHSMRTPHPRFMYAGLDPVYQNQSFLANLGNPDLDPEVNVSYEIGFKSQITKDIGLTLSAYNNNRFDYIVSRRVIVKDQTGRPVEKTMYINQDYAKISGIEVGTNMRFNKHLSGYGNIAYQVARGKSNSARESTLQIAQTGEVPLTSEQYLAWDRPWRINAGLIFAPDSSLRFIGMRLDGLRAFLSFNYTSGFRYTPQEKIGANDLGRPMYQEQTDRYLQEIASAWVNFDLKLSYNLMLNRANRKGIIFSVEVRNLLNNKNAQIINPVTGKAYEYGDDVPDNWRDPRPEYNGPQESGLDPRNPARYLAPTQVLFGMAFRL
jgi:outer membrane receptor protein involved in Fe transport